MLQTSYASEPTAAQRAYLDEQLGAVSRSFALVIPFVEPPTRYYLGTAYLLCRVVDNIEDCTQPEEWKQRRFAEFEELLTEPSCAPGVLAVWEGEPWPGLTDKERCLMGLEDGPALWQIYAQIPRPARDVIHRWTSIMALGMSHLHDPAQPPHLARYRDIDILQDKADYDEYCYYVAGTVGHLASELVIMQYQIPDDVAQVLNSHAQACGRSLQKTNIVKDFPEDLERRICYLPDAWLSEAGYKPLELQGAAPSWKAMVIGDVLDELREATEYLLALPYNASGYRRASLMCLLPAYQTIHQAAARQATLFTPKHRVKISHPTMARCMVDSQSLLFDNAAIRQYSERMEERILSEFDRLSTATQRS